MWNFTGKLVDLFLVLNWHHKDVVLEEACYFLAVVEDHDTDSVLDTFDPVAFVGAAISPLHGTVALPHVVVIVSEVLVATLPGELSVSMLFVILVKSFILVHFFGDSNGFLPLAFAMFHAVEEGASVGVAVEPLVLTEAFRFATDVLAYVYITI